MENYGNTSITDFVLDLSAKLPTPGGGGAAALVGALGTALGGMVASYTIGKVKYDDVDEEMRALKVGAYRVQKELLELIDKDAEVFAPLAGAYKMPNGTEEEKESKARMIQAGMKEASLVPLKIIEKCAEALDYIEIFAKKGNKMMVSDAGCGAIICKAAMQAAWLNVRVNTKGIKDEMFVKRVESKALSLLENYLARADEIYYNIESDFAGE
ncbi:MAG: cyclodeaminase/cyclohydrolase family protein [Clostridiales Family XIII bacterium]|jgi:formiminotetrahydrofolate cyclodeaminase|nr:cyclodeaminase/cyclohydrolase family protein [Clostridiales Family XIII bacterium]